MANMIDYLLWREDLTFDKSPFNEIDALILARLAYIDYKDIIDESDNAMTLSKAYELYLTNIEERFVHLGDDKKLFELVAKSKRFGNIKAFAYVNKFDEISAKQFAAVSFILDKKTIYVSYRGTDSTFIGWKEDFYMIFAEAIPSRIEAISYLNHLKNRYRSAKFLIGGHSKGGNLAIASALFNSEIDNNRIIGIYSFDGPGFRHDIVEGIKDNLLLPYIVNYIPQGSVIGKFLSHPEYSKTVLSNVNGFMQHDVYTWEVLKNHFILAQEDTLSSRIFDYAFEDYLVSLNEADFKLVIDAIFELIDYTNIKTTKEFSANYLKNIPSLLKKVSTLSKHERDVIFSAIKLFGSSLFEGANIEISKAINAKINELKETKDKNETIKSEEEVNA